MINYLTEKHLVKMNIVLLGKYSPGEDVGVRDIGALRMIVSQPKQEVFGKELYPTIEEKAAILMINLIKKHPFHNGNKRTGFMAMDTFLKINGCELDMGKDEKVNLTVDIATYQGDFNELKNDVSELIKKGINQQG